VIHRDLKPDNVLISVEAVLKLIDFGTATRVQPTEEAKRRSTVGTPWYCAPEVINGLDYGKRCDVWSIGCFAIELVSGKPPFDDLNEIACLFKMAEGHPPPLPTGISAECTDFLVKCLQSNWLERPTATELLQHPFLAISLKREAKIKKELIGIIKEMREANQTLQNVTYKKKIKKPTHNVIKL